MTVFLTNMAADHNYEPLAKWGAVRPITRGNYPIFKHVRLIEEICEALVHSTPEDYLAVSGAGFVTGICLSVWLLIHDRCKVLLYDKAQDGYVPRVVKRDGLVLAIEKATDGAHKG